jgi:Tol biopolymer transport system component
MKKLLFLLLIGYSASAQQLAPLTVEKIMRDPKWIGVAPSNVFWSEDGKQLFFSWNPERNQGDSLYSISLTSRTPAKVNAVARRTMPSQNGNYNRAHTKKVYEKAGDIYLLDLLTAKTTQITSSNEREFNASFSGDEKKVLFITNGNRFKR